MVDLHSARTLTPTAGREVIKPPQRAMTAARDFALS